MDKDNVPPPPAPGTHMQHTPLSSPPPLAPDYEETKPGIQPASPNTIYAPSHHTTDSATRKMYIPPEASTISPSLPEQPKEFAKTRKESEPMFPAVPGIAPRPAKPSVSALTNAPKEHPAHEEPFFTQKPVESSQSVHATQPSIAVAPPQALQLTTQPQPVAKPTATPTPAVIPRANEHTQSTVLVEEHKKPIPDLLASKETISRMLKDLPAPQKTVKAPTFHLYDGRVVAGPASLAMLAHDMSDEVFSHHVSAQRNDFATWIREGLGEAELAEQVGQVSTPHELAEVLSQYHLTRARAPVHDEPLPALPLVLKKSARIDVDQLKASFDEIASELDRAKAMQSTVEQDKEVLEERENVLREREEVFKKNLELFEKERQETTKALEDAARLRDELRRRHVELAELQLALEAHKQRLDIAQKDVPKQQELTHDVREDSFAQVASTQDAESPSSDAHAVLDAVENAHRALVNTDVSQARVLYSEARELFYSTHLPEDERRELYNLIRELYTDIELTRMG